MTTKTRLIFSDMPIPPGEVLEEELEARGMSQKELAARLDRPAQAINEIIKAKKSITPETAIGLEKALGIDAHFWTNLESNYRMALARNHEKQVLLDNVQWLNEYPIGEMIKRGWIEAGRDKVSRLRALLRFMGVAVAEPRAYQQAVGFRITEAARQKVSAGALSVWLRKGELDAQEVSTLDYDEQRFGEALKEIRTMTQQPPEEFVPAMTSLCAQSGVSFCVVQELPKIGANGVTRWLSDRKALIQMSIRNKWADIFWFTFFHEAFHLIKHRTHRRILINGAAADPDTEALENEANLLARDFLIDPQKWAHFCEANSFTPVSVQKFAIHEGIAPFIVVGRLQWEKRIKYSQLTFLKERYVWTYGSDN